MTLRECQEKVIYQCGEGQTGFDLLPPRLLSVSPSRANGLWKGAQHSLPHYAVSFVQHGRAIITVERKKYHVGAGAILLYPPHCVRYGQTLDADDYYETYIFQIDTAGATPTCGVRTASDKEKRCQQILSAIIHAVRDGKPDQLLVKSLLLEFFLTHTAEEIFTREAINHSFEVSSKAKEFMEKHIAEEFSLRRIASHVNLSPSRFGHVFKQYTGASPLQYFLMIKIDMAKRELLSTGGSVSEIADLLGFPSIHYFTRVFTARAGVPPATYRRRATAGKDKSKAISAKDGIPFL